MKKESVKGGKGREVNDEKNKRSLRREEKGERGGKYVEGKEGRLKRVEEELVEINR